MIPCRELPNLARRRHVSTARRGLLAARKQTSIAATNKRQVVASNPQGRKITYSVYALL